MEDKRDLSKRVSDLAERCLEFKLQAVEEEVEGCEGGGEEEEEVEKVERDYSYYEEDILQEYADLPLVSKPYDQVRLIQIGKDRPFWIKFAFPARSLFLSRVLSHK